MAEHWEIYPSQVEGNSAFIFVNLEYRDAAPLKNAEDLTWLILHFQNLREDGLPTNEEFDTLNRIEDALHEALEACDQECYLVGRNTSGGTRDFFIYSNNGQAVELVLGQCMVEFAGYEFETGHRAEPDWSTYREFLLPDRRDMQLISNGHLIEVLKEEHDLLEVPREIDHWAFFPTEAGRDEFVTKAVSEGFTLKDGLNPDEEREEWGAVLTRIEPAEYWSIAETTLMLIDMADESGGTYDGWETSLVLESGSTDQAGESESGNLPAE